MEKYWAVPPTIVDYIQYVCTKYMVSCQFLVILTLKEINMTRPCYHRSVEGPFRSEVVPYQLHKYFCDVAELLGCGNHLDALIQYLSQLVLVELVLAHGQQDLDPHFSLLWFCRYC